MQYRFTQTILHSPQTGILDVGYYFAHGKPSNFGFYRIDDKPLATNKKVLVATAKGK